MVCRFLVGLTFGPQTAEVRVVSRQVFVQNASVFEDPSGFLILTTVHQELADIVTSFCPPWFSLKCPLVPLRGLVETALQA